MFVSDPLLYMAVYLQLQGECLSESQQICRSFLAVVSMGFIATLWTLSFSPLQPCE